MGDSLPPFSVSGERFILSFSLNFLLFNKFYSLTTMSVCVLVKFILWFHEQELRFSFHSLGLIMDILIFSLWANNRIKLSLFTWILTQPCNSLSMKMWTVVSCITTKKEALRNSTFILHFLWLQHNLKCLRWLLYYPLSWSEKNMEQRPR